MDTTDLTNPSDCLNKVNEDASKTPNKKIDSSDFFDFVKRFVHYETQFDKQPVANQQEYFAVWLGQQIPQATSFYYSTQNITDAFFGKASADNNDLVTFFSQPMLIKDNQLAHVEIDITRDGHMRYAHVTETFADNTLDPQTITSRAFTYLNKDGNYHLIDCMDPISAFNAKEYIDPIIPWAIFASDDKIAPDEIFFVMRTEAF